MTIRSMTLLAALTLAASPAVAADAPGAPKWDVSAPPGMTTRQVPIDVDQGTWMNVDVSPDGQSIAFDLLGDVYMMPIAGGTPTRIASRPTASVSPLFPTAAAVTTSGS